LTQASFISACFILLFPASELFISFSITKNF
jgi:hypothetical protein